MIDEVLVLELIRRVPKAADQPIPGPISANSVNGFITRTGVFLPEDVRSWLSISNGPCIGPGGFFGIDTGTDHLEIEILLATFPVWKQRQWIPIAGDGCGNYYVTSNQKEFGEGFPVFFVDTSMSVNDPSFIVASDIGHFLIGILKSETGESWWPFDKERMLSHDPQIVDFPALCLPWDTDKPP